MHVIGPEQGLTQPGMTIVCGDSHTATHGAFGALAFGIGTSQVGHVLATQCLLQTASHTYAIHVNGTLKPGVGAKDIILAVIARIGIGGGTGCVFEYTGSAIRALSIEERMTVCNMSIEAGARAGMGVRSKVMHSHCGFFIFRDMAGFDHGGLLEISLRVRYRDGYRRETEREFQGPPKELPITPRR